MIGRQNRSKISGKEKTLDKYIIEEGSEIAKVIEKLLKEIEELRKQL